MTNFTIRFLYEVFFEVCLCIMINASYVDFDSGSQLTAWSLYLFLATVSFITLIVITMLFWKKKGGPQVRDAFEPKSLWRSFWGTRPLSVDTVQRLVKSKAQKEPKSVIEYQKDDDIENQIQSNEKELCPIVAPRDVDFFSPTSTLALDIPQGESRLQMKSKNMSSMGQIGEPKENQSEIYEGGETSPHDSPRSKHE